MVVPVDVWVEDGVVVVVWVVVVVGVVVVVSVDVGVVAEQDENAPPSAYDSTARLIWLAADEHRSTSAPSNVMNAPASKHKKLSVLGLSDCLVNCVMMVCSADARLHCLLSSLLTSRIASGRPSPCSTHSN